ncbi:hypothetical protein K1719_037335 [Acacia pycnantha]|nr:hypothetical protein K1719_039695 [Acacia pycnantha]KAI9080669.1 hypothetical protein K1719_037335 [Acacia pycnantha]
MVKGRQGERVRLYVRGSILGYKRSKSNQYPNTSLIQIEGVNTKEEVAWYCGKRMAYIYKAKWCCPCQIQVKFATQINGSKGKSLHVPKQYLRFSGQVGSFRNQIQPYTVAKGCITRRQLENHVPLTNSR